MTDTKDKLSKPSEDKTKVEETSNTVRNAFFLVFAAALAAYFSRSGLGPAHESPYALRTLPDDYAICSTHSGKIYTVDSDVAKATVDCFLVHNGWVEATGHIDQIQSHWDAYQTELVNTYYGGEPTVKKPLKVLTIPSGSIVVPGLADAHAHLMMYGEKMQLNLEGSQTIDAVLDCIEEYITSHPDSKHSTEEKWVTGFGWDQTRWKNWRGGFPSQADLESRPLLAGSALALSRVDGHAVWVSARAMEIAKAQLPDGQWPNIVEGGEIVRDEATGEPTGVFLDAAMALVPVPPPSAREMEERLERASRDALQFGLTSVHDAAVSADMLEVFKRVAEEGRLPIRVYAMANEESSDYWGDRFSKLEDYGLDGRLNLKSVKLFTDGALGSWGAALLEPYSDKPSTSGLMRVSEDAMRETVNRFWRDGWGVNIHCIGDRANKAVLDIFETLLKGNATEAATRRPRIEHAQIMRVEDLQRVGELGVITSVQPTHATSDMYYAESRLGPIRIRGAYAYQTLSRSSRVQVLPIGSDFPVEGINPLLGFYAAVSRLDVEGNSPHGAAGWYASERLTRAQALKGMTLDAAYASFAEDVLGSLVPGKKADFVVLDTDIMQEDGALADILSAKVQATVVDGRLMYGAF